MARSSNTEARRAETVRALASVMAERGYDGASIQRIAKHAGLAPGLVHYHFQSKREILVALVDTLVAGARSRIDARMAAAASPRERLAAFLDALLATGAGADSNAVAIWALVGAEAIRQPDVRALYGGWMAEAKSQLTAIVREVCRDEAKSSRGTRAMAAGLLATIEGFYAIAAAAPEVVPAGSAAATARRMAFGLIDSQEPA